jgi:hypothetical protein
VNKTEPKTKPKDNYIRFNNDRRNERIAELREWMFPQDFLDHCAMSDLAERYHKSTVDKTPRDVWRFKIDNCKANAEVHKIKPEIWAERVAKIEDATVQTMIARIIWWDFFSNREVSSRWTHLDQYLSDEQTPQVMREIATAEKALQVAQYSYSCASQTFHKNQSYQNRVRRDELKTNRDRAQKDLDAAKSNLPDKETQILALWSCGYTPAMARNRIIQGGE